MVPDSTLTTGSCSRSGGYYPLGARAAVWDDDANRLIHPRLGISEALDEYLAAQIEDFDVVRSWGRWRPAERAALTALSDGRSTIPLPCAKISNHFHT